jgi:hypothetical protein
LRLSYTYVHGAELHINAGGLSEPHHSYYGKVGSCVYQVQKSSNHIYNDAELLNKKLFYNYSTSNLTANYLMRTPAKVGMHLKARQNAAVTAYC